MQPILDDGEIRCLGAGMKAILLSLAIALLMVGCGEEAQKEVVQEEAKKYLKRAIKADNFLKAEFPDYPAFDWVWDSC